MILFDMYCMQEDIQAFLYLATIPPDMSARIATNLKSKKLIFMFKPT